MGFLGTRFGINRYEADENYRKALEYYHMKNLDQAVLHMNNAIELQGRRAEYYAARGFFRMEDGIMDEAADDYDKALQLNRYEILANYGKGVLAFKENQAEAALAYFMNAWAADNDRAETLFYIALCHHRLQDNAQALQWMQQADAIYGASEDREARRRKRVAERWLKVFEEILAKTGTED